MQILRINKLFNFSMQTENFGQWLKTKREAKGWSQDRLARAAGGILSAGYISNLERNYYVGKKGKPTTPDEKIVDGLAVALGEPVDEARRIAGIAPKRSENMSAAAIEVSNLIEDIAPEFQPLVLAVVRTIRQELAATNSANGNSLLKLRRGAPPTEAEGLTASEGFVMKSVDFAGEVGRNDKPTKAQTEEHEEENTKRRPRFRRAG